MTRITQQGILETYTGRPAYSDSVGTAKKCHCKQNVTLTGIFSTRRSLNTADRETFESDCRAPGGRRGGLFFCDWVPCTDRASNKLV